MYTSIEQAVSDAVASVERLDISGALSTICAALLRLSGSRRVETGGGHALIFVPGVPGAVFNGFTLSVDSSVCDPAGQTGAVLGGGYTVTAHTDGREISFVHAGLTGSEHASETSGPFPFLGEGCERLLLHLRALTRGPLTPTALAGQFGPGSEPAALINTLAIHIPPSTPVDPLSSAAASLLTEAYGTGGANPGNLLPAVQAYYSLICCLTAAHALSLRSGLCSRSPLEDAVDLDSPQLAQWLRELTDGRLFQHYGVGFGSDEMLSDHLDHEGGVIADAVRPLIAHISEFEPATSLLRTVHGADLFKDLYQALLPPQLRRARGEHYTPDWLAEQLLDRIGYDGDPSVTVLDPACGSGTFLTLAIRRARQHNASDPTLLDRIVTNIAGSDINSQAVTAARANYLLALSDLLRSPQRIDLPVRQRDAILTTHSGPRFDMVVGNPPWVNWERLSVDWRKRSSEQWERYGLKGGSSPGRFALGKKKLDLAMLFVSACADRYVRDGGKLGFVITQTVFKSQGGEGFRRFSTPGGPLGVVHVDDMSVLHPFPGAAARTALLVLEKGSRTSYPVSYTLWRRARRGRIPDAAPRSEVELATDRIELAARPFGGPARPWVTARPPALAALSRVFGPSPYRARAGTVTWSNAIYWVRVIERVAGSLLLVKSVGDSRTPGQPALIEADLVHPLLRGRDVHEWTAQPSLSLILPHTPGSGWRAIPEDELHRRFPYASAYFGRFRPILLSRSGHRQLRPGHPCYIMGNTGPWLHAPCKVVWREQAGVLTCAVSEPFLPDWSDDAQAVIPDHKLMLVAVDDRVEAHYLCAVLNSAPARLMVRCYAVPTSISTHVLDNVAVPRFDACNDVHAELAALSRRGHAGTEVGPELDRTAAALWGLTGDELAAVTGELADVHGSLVREMS